MTEAQIRYMVDRFLGWRLPEDFNPDGGISFKKTFNEHTTHPMKHEPTGTNLLDAEQASTMVRHMIDGLPSDADEIKRLEKQCAGMANAALNNSQGLMLFERALTKIKELSDSEADEPLDDAIKIATDALEFKAPELKFDERP